MVEFHELDSQGSENSFMLLRDNLSGTDRNDVSGIIVCRLRIVEGYIISVRFPAGVERIHGCWVGAQWCVGEV